MQAFTITDHVAMLRLAVGKANAITPELVTTLTELLDQAAQHEARAIVITGHERYFSGGLSLPALIDLDRTRMTQFLAAFHSAMLRLFTWPAPVIAAINGHAVAAGYVLALQADYRIASDAVGKLGLNEAQLGVGLPALVIETLRLQVPAPALLPIALEGKLFAAEAARAHGMVHEVVAAAELEARALARARELAALPAAAFAQIKHALRRPAVEVIERTAREDTERWLDGWFSPAGRQTLGALATTLSTGKSHTA